MTLLLAGRLGRAERDEWLTLLRAALPQETLVADRSEAEASTIDIAIVANPPPGALQDLPRLALIHSLWAGVDALMRDATLPPQVPIVRMVDPAMSAAMAETALWAVISLHRGFFDYAAQQREARWQLLPQSRADELSVAVLGLGEMGGTAARRLAAQGYRVSGWSTQARAVEGVTVRTGDAALAATLAEAHVVVNLLPLTPATTGLFDARRLAMMRRGASLVNLARGAHVVEADLLDALDRGHLAHAVLDVHAVEPLPAGHPFWQHPRVTLLPHAAALSDARSAAVIAARNLRAFREGRPLEFVVDRQRGY